MPIAPRRHRKPPRLWYDAAKNRWLILDGTQRVNTGCSHGEGGEANKKLIKYIEVQAEKETGKPGKKRPPERVSCAEVIGYYLDKKKDEVARPKELGQRGKKLLGYWGLKNLDEVDGDECDLFEEDVGSASYARRMLGDFQAAINMYVDKGFLTRPVKVSLPAAPEARDAWFTREEAMALGHMMRTEKGPDGRYVWRHLIPYLAVSIVTCSRAARVYRASFVPEAGRPHIDVRTGVYTRKTAGEKKKTNKRAPAVRISGRLLVVLRMLARDRVGLDGQVIEGQKYVCQYEGRAVDPKKSFKTIVRHAGDRYPHLFREPDGTLKKLVRHSLRHTGITWMALDGVDPYQIIKHAGITMPVFERVYSHAFPGGLEGVHAWQRRRKKEEGDDDE